MIIMLKKYQQFASLFMRLVMGYGFMAHGWAKLSRGVLGFEKLLILIHTPFPHLLSWGVPLIELLGGFAILIGVFVSNSAIPLIFVQATAMFTIHIKYGFSTIKTIGLSPDGPLFGLFGYEINFLFFVGLVVLFFFGVGVFFVVSL